MTRRIDDEAIILDVTSGRYFSLNSVGALIWDQLESECSVEELVEIVIGTFEVDRQQALGDVRDLVGELSEAGLVDATS